MSSIRAILDGQEFTIPGTDAKVSFNRKITVRTLKDLIHVHTLSVSAMRHEVVYTEKFAVHLDRSSFELDDLDPVSIDMAFNEWLHGMGLFIDTPNGAVYFGQPGPR